MFKMNHCNEPILIAPNVEDITIVAKGISAVERSLYISKVLPIAISHFLIPAVQRICRKRIF